MVLPELWLTHWQGRDSEEGGCCSQTTGQEAQTTLREGTPTPQGGGRAFSKHSMSSGGKASLDLLSSYLGQTG